MVVIVVVVVVVGGHDEERGVGPKDPVLLVQKHVYGTEFKTRKRMLADILAGVGPSCTDAPDIPPVAPSLYLSVVGLGGTDGNDECAATQWVREVDSERARTRERGANGRKRGGG